MRLSAYLDLAMEELLRSDLSHLTQTTIVIRSIVIASLKLYEDTFGEHA